MSRDAKGSLRLSMSRSHEAEARVRPEGRGIRVEFHRSDCKGGPLGGPVMFLALDEAQAFQRAVQGAVDEAYRRAKAARAADDIARAEAFLL